MNPNTNSAPTKTFEFIDGNTLMKQEYEPLQFAIDEILPSGIFIIGGSGKIGKSWLVLDMCIAVATGNKLWNFPAEQGGVLYLALEDNLARLQGRLDRLEARESDISSLKLVTEAAGITQGLIDYTNNFINAYPDTRLVVIDTLERIRDTLKDGNMYSCDYRDMTSLREITNKHRLTLLLVHHTRKMHDPDPLNMLSGSTGLVGAVDGVWVMDKKVRTENNAKLTIANLDTDGFCFDLELDEETCKWKFIGNHSNIKKELKQKLASLLSEFLNEDWCGTATELCKDLKSVDSNHGISEFMIKKILNDSVEELQENNIEVNYDRNSKIRLIMLSKKSLT